MPEVLRGSSRLPTFFDLRGDDEPDMTDALGWCLGAVPPLLERLVRRCLNDPTLAIDPARAVVRLQRHVESGRTDIEVIESGNYHVILEAKKGWEIPSDHQLTLYQNDLLGRGDGHRKAPRQCLALLTDATPEYARAMGFDSARFAVPMAHLTWATVLKDIAAVRGKVPVARRWILDELSRYLGAVVHDRRVDSNMVYVVSLNPDTPAWMTCSFIDVVSTHGRYFHAYGKHWPKEQPNYLGFRYNGRLQSIHHVESREIRLGLKGAFPQIVAEPPGEEGWSYAVYQLGPAIAPPKEIRTGKLFRAARVDCMIDTLLTGTTISQARDLTDQRIAQAALES